MNTQLVSTQNIFGAFTKKDLKSIFTTKVPHFLEKEDMWGSKLEPSYSLMIVINLNNLNQKALKKLLYFTIWLIKPQVALC